jgi:hypothetical protein
MRPITIRMYVEVRTMTDFADDQMDMLVSDLEQELLQHIADLFNDEPGESSATDHRLLSTDRQVSFVTDGGALIYIVLGDRIHLTADELTEICVRAHEVEESLEDEREQQYPD